MLLHIAEQTKDSLEKITGEDLKKGVCLHVSVNGEGGFALCDG